ncbi:uncharacterized protein MONBRDRAFT_24100 [Monosiga brevicollis MX1]|uniref:Uncharacterized protein n=1 Tax=Monosiga brevicollis TaxID=81824 RepID=A9UVD9_MONBE|nr:uncharacterized protein MONBRDRAFT_24100 [Monosiga brevicollis MX1]EDQ90381.1 predicted protein [Monosiga brevicollis MX1]|eukprot:XP_001744432.1 hypothetical protein [Monosiga brevicollis MX1]
MCEELLLPPCTQVETALTRKLHKLQQHNFSKHSLSLSKSLSLNLSLPLSLSLALPSSQALKLSHKPLKLSLKLSLALEPSSSLLLSLLFYSPVSSVSMTVPRIEFPRLFSDVIKNRPHPSMKTRFRAQVIHSI